MNCPIPGFARPDFTRDFITDQAITFVLNDLEVSGVPSSPRGMQLLAERCTAHLIALCNCSQQTAEKRAAQAVAEVMSECSPVSIDTDSTTSFALFLRVRGSDKTVVITTSELERYLMKRPQLTS